jgi:acyl-CoA synthetase (AMP-forming)/AMP-acid ligase II
MNVAEILRSHAQQYPHELAMIDIHRGRPRQMTFRELEEAAGRTAALLGDWGLRAGDTVLVFHPMSSELYIALAALFRLGLVAMFVDPSAGRSYIDRCCQMHPPRAMIAGSKVHLLRLLSPALRRIPLKFSIGPRNPWAIPLEAGRRTTGECGICRCEADSPALISFTSGSTGQPKAALRTHGFLLAQHRAIERNLGLVPREIELVALPVFVLANLASRVTSLIPAVDLRRPDAVRPAALVRQIQEFGATRTAAPPALYERVVEYCEHHQLTLPHLTKVFTGGGPVSPRLLHQLQRVAPGATVTVVYGSTEAEPISKVSLSEMQPADLSAMLQGRGLLTGQPVPSIRMRIIQDHWGRRMGPFSEREFEQLIQPQGTSGEIVVSGEHVLPGYLHGTGDEETKFQVGSVGWHRTGDAGYVDSSGRLWLLGRCAARVDDRRGAVYPLGVESAALRYDYVRRAAFASHQGQRVLVIELSRQAVKPDFASLLKSLAFAGVDSIRIVKRLPMDKRHNAKVDYAALQELLG